MIIAVIISSFISLIAGIFIGFFGLEAGSKRELRQRLEPEAGKAKVSEKRLVEFRREKREPADYPEVLIRAPVLDSAGVVAESETREFSAVMVNVTRHGMAIISQQFLSVGLDIEVACKIPKYCFSFRGAEVKHVTVLPKGLKIGLQMFDPLDMSQLNLSGSKH